MVSMMWNIQEVLLRTGLLLALALVCGSWKVAQPAQGAGACTGVVRISTDPEETSEIDCESPCAQHCTVFFVTTPCGYGALCGCSTVGPNTGPDVALVPPSGNGIPCMVGTCPDGTPPEKSLGRKRGRKDPDTGRAYYTISVRARCDT
jgi:hypothetical protein